MSQDVNHVFVKSVAISLIQTSTRLCSLKLIETGKVQIETRVLSWDFMRVLRWQSMKDNEGLGLAQVQAKWKSFTPRQLDETA